MAMDVDLSEKSRQSGPTPNRKYNKLRYPKAFPFKKLPTRATQMEHKRLLMDYAILCCLESPQRLLYPCHIFRKFTTFEGSDQSWSQEFDRSVQIFFSVVLRVFKVKYILIIANI